MQSAPLSPAQGPSEIRWRFGPFTVWEAQRRIERAGETVRLGARTFELLLQLIKRSGEVLSKEELLATVWAGVVVEETSVRVHMSTLRKALGEPGAGEGCREWISNIPLRGYRFNGRVHREPVPIDAGQAAQPFARLPVRLTRLIGRDADLDRIQATLGRARLVTLVGTGGIGKTSVAIQAAACEERQRSSQVAFVDLSPLDSGERVLSTLARALSVATDMGEPLQAIVRRLAARDALLLIDNCEHVIDTVAPLAAGLLAELPRLRILATSREALRVQGEEVLRLAPLAVPKTDDVSFAEAMRAPAVELLAERAAAAGSRVFAEPDGVLLARIARRIDGIPLAIELVAARLGVQSIGDLALRLNDHMCLYSLDNRAVLPRHTTLAATLEWSTALLSPGELKLFRCLSVFRGRFDVESALGVAGGDMDADVAFDALISLANKSLVFFDSNDAIAPYRLLSTTRSYAAALPTASDERRMLLRRHARLMLERMQEAAAQLRQLDEQAWLDRHAYHLDDVRFAIEACLGELADVKSAAALITASATLWFQVSQLAEYRDWVGAALALVDRQPEPDLETATRLNTALVSAVLNTGKPTDELRAVCDRALSGALSVKVRHLELHARWGCCTHDMFRGEYAAALRNAELLQGVVQSWDDPPARILAHRVSAMANNFCGRFAESRRHSEAALGLSGAFGRTSVTAAIGPEATVAAKAVLCRTLWIQGETASALAVARDAVARAESAGNSVSLCSALYGACAVALWAGELELAGRWIPRMREEARRRGLEGWHRYAEWFDQGLQCHTVDSRDDHIRQVRARLAACDAPHKEMLLTFSPGWLDDEIIARIRRGEGLWCAAEAWRALGRRHEKLGRTAAAQANYLLAVETARQQGALSWELRAANSLALLWLRLNPPQQALGRLDELCERAAAVGCDSLEFAQACALRMRLGCR